jgi:hypothetical protein
MKLETYCTIALVLWCVVTGVILLENIAAALCR